MTTVTLWGNVDTNGNVVTGSGGFQVEQQATGKYLITFSPTFSGEPAIVGSQVNFGNSGEDTRDNVIFPYLSSSSATAVTGDASGDPQNRAFSFIVIGNSAS
jgi:hypothetical protein